jgi:hypothetical protein
MSVVRWRPRGLRQVSLPDLAVRVPPQDRARAIEDIASVIDDGTRRSPMLPRWYVA